MMEDMLRYHISADDDVELRQAADGQEYLEGLAVPFGKQSQWMGFYEVIEPGCEVEYPPGGDVRALVNHDGALILARTGNATLELRKGDHGIKARIRMPDVTYARDLMTLVRNGTVRGMSFGFRVPAGGEWYDPETQTFHVRKMMLREVSVVGDSAYLDTTVQARARELLAKYDQHRAALTRHSRELAIRKHELRLMELRAP